MIQTAETTSTSLLVTIESTHGALDLELPADLAINKLLPLLLRHHALAGPSDPHDPAQWTLGIKGGQRFDTANTLGNYDVLEGAVLQLQPTAVWADPQPEPETELVLPNENRLLIIKNATSKLSSLFKRSR